MKRLVILLMVLGLVLAGILNSQADTTRTIALKAKVVTSDEVTASYGVVVYRVTGYANAANAIYGLYDTNALGSASTTTVRIEGGEATQYDALPTLDFGDEGLPFDTGLTTVVSGAYVTIVYR